ncbi:MAG: polysaccharide pyruvyl transferase family protein [Candidatus Acidiferrum sp.]
MSIPVEYEAAPAAKKELLSQTATKRSRIAFFGIFGIQNLGNECTLQAILHNARKRLPCEDIYVISFNPDDTSRRHNVAAFAVSQQNFTGVVRRGGFWGGLAKLLRICRRVPGELMDWFTAIKTLRGTDLVVMTGTGMLTDYMTTASGFPYDVFRWTAAARLAGCKVRFVGVGVGPIYGRLSRWLITTALSLADYRSFRDQNSKNRIKKNGFDSDNDPVFPDLAFSLAPDILPRRLNDKRHIREVGLGVMDHRDIHLWNSNEHQAQYSAYLEKMCDFVLWLVERKYAIRILQGDAKHDASTRAELRARLEKRRIRYDQAGITDEGSATVEELIAQIAEVDIVVSPRFHNLLLGLMLNIPAVSISYDPKNDSLLEGVGLGKYCQPLAELDLQKLIDQFVELEARGDEVKPMIEKKAKEYRNLLEEQYDLIFRELERLPTNSIASQPTTQGRGGLHEASR